MKPEASGFLIGLDLGQKRDFSALAVVERLPGRLPEYHLRHLERLNLNTPYPAVAARACDLVAKSARHGDTKLVMDATGVGVPVLDLVQAQGVAQSRSRSRLGARFRGRILISTFPSALSSRRW